MRKLCQFWSTFFTWSFSWILPISSCPRWTYAKEILFLDDSKWNVWYVIYMLPSHLLIHFRSDLYFWNVYFRGFFITFSQGWPIIFDIGGLHITNFYMNSSSSWWWFVSLFWWLVVSLCLIFDISDNLIQ